MMTGYHWYILAASLAGTLALFAILAQRKQSLKFAALACTALFLPLAYITANDLLSRPKPLQIEVAKHRLQNAIVAASVIQEKQAIYLWLRLPDVLEPRAYRLPWNEQMAIELHKAQNEAEVDGTEVQMQLPEGADLESEEPVFHKTVLIPPPPKDT